MKKFFVFMIALALVVFLMPLCNAAFDTSNLDVVLTEQNPFPAEPGGNVSIEIEIQNDGLTDASGIVVEIFPQKPFSLLGGQEKTKKFNIITAKGSVKATYKLTIDESAASSDYDLEFRVYTENSRENYLEKKVTISVQGIPHIVVDSIQTDPKNIEPAGTVKIDAVLKNVGSGTARKTEAEISSQSSEIVPVLSKGKVFVGDIEPGQSATAHLELSISKDAEYKTYTTTLTVTYKDESNIPHTETFLIGIPVKGTVVLDVISVEPNFNRGTLDVEIANKGTTDALSIQAKLVVDGKPIAIDYASQLKSTKKTTMNFPLITRGSAKLLINYTGPGLERNSIEKDLGVLDYKMPSSGSDFNFLWLILLGVAGYFVWKRFFSKKHKKKRR